MSSVVKQLAAWSVPVIVMQSVLFLPVGERGSCADATAASATHCDRTAISLAGAETSWVLWGVACVVGVLAVWLVLRMRRVMTRD